MGDRVSALCGEHTTSSKRTIADLPSALDRLESITNEIGDREPVFFLDFDGTLAAIVDRPEDATLPEGTRRALGDLAGRRRIAVVSGRDLDDLRTRVGLEDLHYAGSHGLRLAGPQGWEREHEEARHFLPALDAAQEALEKRLRSIEGAQVERKRYAVAVHLRRVPESQAQRVREEVEAVQQAHPEDLRIGAGRKVLELRPALDWDKGRALDWLLEAIGIDRAQAFPIYIGDDVTDEDAFRAIEDDGLGIVVQGRDGDTRARLALADPGAVRRLLLRLDEALGRP